MHSPLRGCSHCTPPSRPPEAPVQPQPWGNHFPSAQGTVLTISPTPWSLQQADTFYLPGPGPPPQKRPPELQQEARAPSPPLSPGKLPLVPIWDKPPCPNMVKSEHTAPGHKLESRYPAQRKEDSSCFSGPCTCISQSLLGNKFQTTTDCKTEKPGKTILLHLETFFLHSVCALAEVPGMGNDFPFVGMGEGGGVEAPKGWACQPLGMLEQPNPPAFGTCMLCDPGKVTAPL